MSITDEELKRLVWEKARIVEGYAPNMYRKDACGAWMIWDKYGVKDNIYGWEIDHIYPVSRLEAMGFSQDDIWNIDNLRALQHQNNESKGDDYPSYTAVVTAMGSRNVPEEKNLIVNEKIREKIKTLYQL